MRHAVARRLEDASTTPPAIIWGSRGVLPETVGAFTEKEDHLLLGTAASQVDLVVMPDREDLLHLATSCTQPFQGLELASGSAETEPVVRLPAGFALLDPLSAGLGDPLDFRVALFQPYSGLTTLLLQASSAVTSFVLAAEAAAASLAPDTAFQVPIACWETPFEPGFANDLTRELERLYTLDSVKALRAIDGFVADGRVDVYARAAALEWLGAVQDAATRVERRGLMERFLEATSSALRDAAMTGLVNLWDVQALPAMESAAARETVSDLRRTFGRFCALMRAAPRV